MKRAGKEVYLGYYATAEEAALAYARTPEAQRAANPSLHRSRPKRRRRQRRKGSRSSQATVRPATRESACNAPAIGPTEARRQDGAPRLFATARRRPWPSRVRRAHRPACRRARRRPARRAAAEAAARQAVRHGAALGGALHPDFDPEDGINVEVIEVVEVYEEDAEDAEGAEGSEEDDNDDEVMGGQAQPRRPCARRRPRG